MRSTGHIRQRTPGSWEVRYSLGTNPATGKRRMATTTVRAIAAPLRRSCAGYSKPSMMAPTLILPA